MKQKIESSAAPAAIGPYSQAIRSGNLLFASGQIPLDPATMKIVDGGIQEQTHRVLKNITAVLSAAKASFDDVVSCQIFLVDLKDFAEVNKIYSEYFKNDPRPARTTIQVAALPLGSLVEIAIVAEVK